MSNSDDSLDAFHGLWRAYPERGAIERWVRLLASKDVAEQQLGLAIAAAQRDFAPPPRIALERMQMLLLSEHVEVARSAADLVSTRENDPFLGSILLTLLGRGGASRKLALTITKKQIVDRGSPVPDNLAIGMLESDDPKTQALAIKYLGHRDFRVAPAGEALLQALQAFIMRTPKKAQRKTGAGILDGLQRGSGMALLRPADVPRISELSAESAYWFARNWGLRPLRLDGVTRVDEGVLPWLTDFRGKTLSFATLTEVSPADLGALSGWKGTELTVGIERLTVEQAEAITRWRGAQRVLCLNGVTALSDEVAAVLGRWTGRRLHLDGLTEISSAQLEAFAPFRGQGKTLTFDGVRALPPHPPLGVLAMGILRLGSVCELNRDAAVELAKSKIRTLYLAPECTAEPAAVEALSSWRRSIRVGDRLAFDSARVKLEAFVRGRGSTSGGC